MTNNIKLGLGFAGTNFSRQMTINDVAEDDAAIETVRAKVKAVNASLKGGTSDGLSDFFRADDFDSTLNIGALNAITSCEISNVDEVILI